MARRAADRSRRWTVGGAARDRGSRPVSLPGRHGCWTARARRITREEAWDGTPWTSHLPDRRRRTRRSEGRRSPCRQECAHGRHRDGRSARHLDAVAFVFCEIWSCARRYPGVLDARCAGLRPDRFRYWLSSPSQPQEEVPRCRPRAAVSIDFRRGSRNSCAPRQSPDLDAHRLRQRVRFCLGEQGIDLLGTRPGARSDSGRCSRRRDDDRWQASGSHTPGGSPIRETGGIPFEPGRYAYWHGRAAQTSDDFRYVGTASVDRAQRGRGLSWWASVPTIQTNDAVTWTTIHAWRQAGSTATCRR